MGTRTYTRTYVLNARYLFIRYFNILEIRFVFHEPLETSLHSKAVVQSGSAKKDVLKFRKIHMNVFALESFLSKVECLSYATLL